ncbi:hypothetical protein C0389_06650 [bacterium]|nr:hypothetical protein [bacterium]
MKSKISLALRIILGALFIVSAYSKFISLGLIEIILVDHGIVSTRETAAILVRILIGFEFALGILFFQPFSLKRFVIPVSSLFLAGFTIYLAYTGFILKDTQNCGCFGEMIEMSPVESILKNTVLLGLLVLLFKLCDEKKNYFVMPIITAIAIATVFIGVPLKSQKDIKFVQYTNFVGQGRIDLSQGDKLITIMNTECDHCQFLAKDLAGMKKKMEWFPEMYTLFFSEGNISVDSFKVITNYDLPYRVIEVKEFFSLIGQSPPRIYWLRDGVVKEIWDKDFLKSITLNFSGNKSGQ